MMLAEIANCEPKNCEIAGLQIVISQNRLQCPPLIHRFYYLRAIRAYANCRGARIGKVLVSDFERIFLPY